MSKVQITSGNIRQKERMEGDRGGGGRSEQVFRREVTGRAALIGGSAGSSNMSRHLLTLLSRKLEYNNCAI